VRPAAPLFPRSVLVAAAPFPGGVDGARAAGAIARGLAEAGRAREVVRWPLASRERALSEELGEAAPAFDDELRGARAVIVAAARLWEGATASERIAGDPLFEIATRARQGGIPAYAILARRPTAFEGRILDLQVVLVATTPRELAAAGRRLAALI
jgi:hypothetical protein